MISLQGKDTKQKFLLNRPWRRKTLEFRFIQRIFFSVFIFCIPLFTLSYLCLAGSGETPGEEERWTDDGKERTSGRKTNVSEER